MSASGFAVAIPAREQAPGDTLLWVEKALIVLALLIFLGAFRTLLQSGGDDRADGSALFQAVSGSIYLASMVILLVRGVPATLVPLMKRAWPLIVLTLLPLLSTLWSQDAGPTFRRAVALILSSWLALYIVLRFDTRTILSLFTIAFAIFAAVTILAVGIPGQGITPGGAYAGAWRGLTGNKNELGRSLGIAAALLLPAALLNMTGWRRTALATGILCLPLLLLSKSATSLLAAVLGLGLGTGVYVLLGGKIGRYRLRPELRVLLGLLAVTSGILLFTVAWTPLLQALGRDPTLTGRTKLWQWSLQLNEDRRLLGSGYRAFWIDDNTRYFFLTFAWNKGGEGERSDSFAGPTHAHSGYVDLILELGIVGLSLFAIVVFSALINLRRVLARQNLALGFIFAVIIVFLLIYAITARSFLQQAEGLWTLFAILYLLAIKETLPLASIGQDRTTGAGAVNLWRKRDGRTV